MDRGCRSDEPELARDPIQRPVPASPSPRHPGARLAHTSVATDLRRMVSPQPDELTPAQREIALAKFQTDRAHELELDRAAGGYEHSHFNGLFALNGGAAAAFVALQGKDVPLLALSPGRAWTALGCWLAGLIVAYVASYLAYEAQKTYSDAMRARRHAIALRLFGRHDDSVLGLDPKDTPASLHSSAVTRLTTANRRWKRATFIGFSSVVLFAIGAILAALALADFQAG